MHYNPVWLCLIVLSLSFTVAVSLLAISNTLCVCVYVSFFSPCTLPRSLFSFPLPWLVLIFFSMLFFSAVGAAVISLVLLAFQLVCCWNHGPKLKLYGIVLVCFECHCLYVVLCCDIQFTTNALNCIMPEYWCFSYCCTSALLIFHIGL